MNNENWLVSQNDKSNATRQSTDKTKNAADETRKKILEDISNLKETIEINLKGTIESNLKEINKILVLIREEDIPKEKKICSFKN